MCDTLDCVAAVAVGMFIMHGAIERRAKVKKKKEKEKESKNGFIKTAFMLSCLHADTDATSR